MISKKNIAAFAVFIAVGFCVFFSLSRLVRYKESYYFKDLFYKGDVEYDVLFFGASHPHCAIKPVQLWDEYGISSYNLATSGESVSLTYFAVKSAIETAHPKVIVVDMGSVKDVVGRDYVNIGTAHKTLDAIPFGKTRKEAVDYLIENGEIDSPYYFLSNIWTYHNRIYELLRYDYEVPYSNARGWNWGTSIVETGRPVPDNGAYAEFKGGDGVRDYKKIVELCRDNNIFLIAAAMPDGDSYYNRHAALFNSLADYTRDQGFEVMDLNYEIDDIGLDYRYDFGGSSHLNAMGAEKVTRYLGAKLIGTHGIEDRRQDTACRDFNKTRQKYLKEIVQYLGYQNDAIRYLEMSKDREFRTEVYARDPEKLRSIYGFEYIIKDYLGITVEHAESEALGENSDVLIRVLDDSGNMVSEKKFIFNETGGILTTTGEEVESVNYFPEVDED